MKLFLFLAIALGLQAAEQSLLSFVKKRPLGLSLDFFQLETAGPLDWNYQYKAEDNMDILRWRFWSMPLPPYPGTDKRSVRIQEGDTLGKIIIIAIFYSGTAQNLGLAISRGLVLDEENCGKLLFLLCTETDDDRKADLLSLILSNKKNHSFVHIRSPLGLTNLTTFVASPKFCITSRYTSLIRAGADILALEGFAHFRTAFHTMLEFFSPYRSVISDLLKIAIIFGRTYSVAEVRRMTEDIDRSSKSLYPGFLSPGYLKELIGKLFEMRQDLTKSIFIWWVSQEALIDLGEDCSNLVRHNNVLRFRLALSEIDLRAQSAPHC